MPTRPAAAPGGNPALSPLIAAAGLVAAIVASYFRMPGALALLLALTLAAWMYQEAPAVRGAEPDPKTARSGRLWRSLRWKAIVPNGTWLMHAPDELDGFRQRASSLVKVPVLSDVLGVLAWALLPTRFVHAIALALAAAAFTLPADAWEVEFPLTFVNAIAAYAAVMSFDAALRTTATVYDPSPGVNMQPLIDGLRTGDGTAWRALVGLVLLGGAVAVGVALALIGLEATWLFVPWLVLPIATGVIATAACLHGVYRAQGLEAWRDKVEARRAWDGRWEGLKQPDVFLVEHQRVGDAVVDTFDAPPSLGAAGAINLYAKVIPFLGAGVSAAMLTVPDTDSQGQPIRGSAHPAKFRVVTWPADAQVDISDPATPQDVVALRAETAVFQAAAESKMPVAILLEVTSVATDDSPRAAWVSQWTSGIAGLDIVKERLGAGGFASGTTFCFGDLDGATLTDRTLLPMRDKLEATSRWSQRWHDLLKKDAIQPVLQYEHKREAKFDGQTTIHFQPFLFPQGLLLSQWFEPNISQGLASTLKAAPFVTVTGLTGQFMPQGQPGERMRQGFAVIWSERPVPTSPANVPPTASKDAQKWVLAGVVNTAFDAAKLPRPEIVDASCLTSQASRGHIWKLNLRLFDGTTTADVKGRMEKLRQSMGSVPWLRITEGPYGVTLYAGVPPRAEGTTFDPRSKGAVACAELDWEQAFIDTGLISPMDATAPKMLESAPMESNPKVTRFLFTMPRGLSLSKVRESVPKLRAATVNDYVDIREGETADRFVVLASEQNPIPFPAFLDWDQIAETDGKMGHRLPFAAAVDGSTVVFDWTVDPHLNVLGASGGGKSILLQVLMVGAMARGCDVFLVDPVKGGQDFDFATPWLRANIAQGDYVAAGEVLQRILAEADERKLLNVKHKVGNYRDLPEDVRPKHMFVFIDEFQSLIKNNVKLPREPESNDDESIAAWEEQRRINAGVAKLTSAVGKLAREARSVGVTLVLAGQAMKADELAKAGIAGLKTNFSRIAVGKMSYGELSSAFKDPQSLPDLGTVVPPGRGLFESTAAEGKVIQSWFEPGSQPKLRERLLELRDPIDDARRLDVDALTQRILANAPRAFGEIIDDADEVIELTAEDLGLDLGGLTLDLSTLVLDAAPADEPAEADEDDDETEEERELIEYAEAAFEMDEFALASPSDSPHAEIHDDPTRPGLAFGRDIPLPDEAPITGWAKGDALHAYLIAHPGIEVVRWEDPELDELDDMGVPKRDLALEIARLLGVELTIAEVPVPAELPTSVEEPVLAEVPAVVEVPAPTQVPTATEEPIAEAPKADDDDWFAAPTLKVQPPRPDISF